MELKSGISQQIVNLDASTTIKLQQLAIQTHVTLNTVIQSLWGVLLAYYNNVEDVVFGATVSGRPADLRGIERTIGLFINTIPVRVQTGNLGTFKELLQQVDTEALAGKSYHYSPLADIQAHTPLKRDLLDHLLIFENLPNEEESLSFSAEIGFILEQEDMFEHTHYDFVLAINPGQTISFEFTYNNQIYCSAQIERIGNHYKQLLISILENVNIELKKLYPLTVAERQQLIDFSATIEIDYPKDQTIVDLFQAQVEKTPKNIAIVFEKQQLSYQKLNMKANQLAHYLITLGVGAETLVGICVKRSLEMMIGLLGILKAGGAYVPIDPDYPPERLQFMLEDSAMSVLLSQSGLLTRLPSFQSISRMKVICLDSEWEHITARYGENPPRQSGPKNLAYVIYTSGSTGMPKGVEIPHSNLVNVYHAWESAYQLSNLRNHLQMANFSFDVFTGDWVRALCSGAKLVLCPRDVLMVPKNLYQLLCTEKVDSAEFVPIVIRNLWQYLEESHQQLDFIKLLIIGSDIWYFEEYKKLQKVCSPHTRIINSYGLSEATIDSTYFEQTTLTLNQNTPVPIGKPFAGVQVYLLDVNHNPTPLGVPGELCIAGRGLARGYLNRPELTAERFIEIQVFGKPQRFYKTGDLARLLPDGNIEYLDRLDYQVKLRGFRIELSEIEVTLSQHEAVKEAVVVLYKKDDNPHLVAYVTLAMPIDEVTGVLRDWLKARLPEYMLPASFTVLDKLPLTPNGKIDRNALPTPETGMANKHYLAPRDTLEFQLAQIWENVLEVRPIGIRDNFFDLGGHSLLAVRLMVKIEQQLKGHLPLATLFQNSTIEQLATVLRQQTKALPWSPVVAIQTDGKKTPLFCVHPGGGNVLCYFELAQCLGKEQPFYGLQAFGMEDGQIPYTQIVDMAKFYIGALKTFQPHGPYQIGGWCIGGLIAFEIARQLQAQENSVSLLALFDTVVLSTMKEYQQPKDDAQLLVNLFEKEISLSLERLRQLTPDEQLTYIIEQGKQVNLFPPDIELTQAQRLIQVYKTNMEASRCYQPPSYCGKIMLFKPTEIPKNIFLESDLGWRNSATEGVEIIQVPGNHESMLKSPHVRILAEQLKLFLK